MVALKIAPQSLCEIMEDNDEVIFDVDLSQSGTCLTIQVHVPHALSNEEFAAILQDFVEELRDGKIEIETLPDDKNH